MKPLTIHMTESFGTNEEFLCFALTHPKISLTRMQWEFAEACVAKYSKYLDRLLEIHPQINLICDDSRVAVLLAKQYGSKAKEQGFKFKADLTIGD